MSGKSEGRSLRSSLRSSRDVWRREKWGGPVFMVAVGNYCTFLLIVVWWDIPTELCDFFLDLCSPSNVNHVFVGPKEVFQGLEESEAHARR